MSAGLVKGEGFAVDASVMEADASRYHGKAPEEIDWSAPERQTRAVVEFLSGLEADDPYADRKPPKVISPTDPCSAWTAMANRSDGTFSRSDFTFDKEKNEYRCPNGKALRTTGKVHDGRTILYRASMRDCGPCP